MEKVKDLLNPKNDKMQIRDDKTRGVFVEGLTELVRLPRQPCPAPPPSVADGSLPLVRHL